MTRLFPFTIEEQIACVEREIKLRRRVYPRKIFMSQMSEAFAADEIGKMEAVLDTLKTVAAKG